MDKSKQTLLKLVKYNFFSPKKFSSVSKFSTPKEFLEIDKNLVRKFEEIQKKIGFIPNIFYLLARRPIECKAFFDYHDALMAENNSSLNKSEKEMIVVATSGLNHCHYCVVAHGAILRIYEKNPYIADQIAINHKKSELNFRQRIMLDFAIKVSKEAENITEEDHKFLKDNGFTEEDIWDIISISSFFAMSNRLANAAFLKPNLEFYSLGRTNNKKT